MDTFVKNSKIPHRRPSIDSDHTKRKSPRACTPCRKRKVKCSGQQPCDRCVKNPSVTCIYDKPQQKKDTPRPLYENHEPRLRAVESFLKHFSVLLDKKEAPEAPLHSSNYRFSPIEKRATTRLSITTTGQGYYVPDTILRTDQVPDIYNSTIHSRNWNPVIGQQQLLLQQYNTPPQHIRGGDLPIQEKLLKIYFQFVDPVIPLLHKPSFFQELNNTNPLLLNAMYCVASRWDMDVPSTTSEPRGWAYYQNAINLLDSSPINLNTVQALFLLLKYNEHVRRLGFVWRTRYYFSMILRMCKDLGLSRNIICTSREMAIEIEKRKRTFWAIYCYDVMMSIENGTLPHFRLDQINNLVHSPQALVDESQEQEKIVHFLLLTKITRMQASIVEFIHAKHKKKNDDKEEEASQMERLANDLKTTIGLITSTTKFPQKDQMCYTTCFLYLASCFATILLHRPYTDYATVKGNIHQSHCTEAAVNIQNITQLVLECNAFEDIYCSIRGVQQIVHYLSASITIFSLSGSTERLNNTMMMATRLARISPCTEVIGQPMTTHNNKDQHQQQQHNNNNKRKSFHDYNHNHVTMETPNQTQQSLLGLLYQENHQGDTGKSL